MSKAVKNITYTAEDEVFDPMEFGVTDADVASADRLLASVADDMDKQVDYASMLRRIKADAMEQGLAAAAARMPDELKKRRRAKRILRYAASVAAAFVLGLGVLGVVKAVTGPANVPDDSRTGDVTADSRPARTAAATEAVPATEVANAVDETPAAVVPTQADYPAETREPVDYTPLPTEFAVKGGRSGYTYIKGFETPASSEELIPPAIPSFMAVEPFENELGYYAYGKSETGKPYSIDCRLSAAQEQDLPIGAVLYTLHDSGRVSYIWRIDEQSIMHIDFEGFDYSEAEEMLLSYTVPEMMHRINNY